MYRHLVGIVLIGLVLNACSSSMPAGQLPEAVAKDGPVPGIPYRVAKRFNVVIYEKRVEGYVKVNSQPFTLADPNRVYWIGFEGLPLSNGTIDVAFNPDSTLQTATLKSTTTVPATFTALGTSATTVATGVETLRTAKEAEEAASATAATAAARNRIAAEAAYHLATEAELARIELENNPSASAGALLKARNAERLAKLNANEAARLALLPPYFPDIVPGIAN